MALCHKWDGYGLDIFGYGAKENLPTSQAHKTNYMGLNPRGSYECVYKSLGAVHILRQPLEGVSQMLTIADEGG